MRHDDTQSDDFAQDSFLDVVANIVGVLIILVMLFGATASSGLMQTQELASEDPAQEESHEDSEATRQALEAQLTEAEHKLGFEVNEYRDTIVRTANIKQQSAFQEQLRLELAVHRAAVEQDMEQRRDALSAEDQRKYDVQNKISQVKIELNDLANRQLALLAQPTQVEEIQVEPTPVARSVNEDAVHIRLLAGKVCKVPFLELMDEALYEQVSIQRELSTHGRVNRVVGPIDGFRLRIKTINRVQNQAVNGPLAGQPRLANRPIPVFYFQPVADGLGESIDQAMLPDSNFRNMMASVRRKTSVVVAWVYEDSFDDYRSLRKLLAETGFTIAVYSLPVGEDISASQNGTDPMAQ